MIESIALVGAALSHILNAQGEKIQQVEIIDNIDDLLEINCSVNKMIINAIHLEQAYYERLDAISKLCGAGCVRCTEPCKPNQPECPCPPPPCPKPQSPCPPPPCPKPQSPCPPSPCPKPQSPVSVFTAAAVGCPWTGCTAMKLRQDLSGDNGINLHCENCASSIVLPAGKKYKITYDIELVNRSAKPVTVNMRLCHKNTVLLSKDIFKRADNTTLTSSDHFVFEIPSGYKKCTLGIWLLSPVSLTILKGKILIAEN